MISVAPLSRVIISCIGEITIAQNSRVRSSLGCLSVNESFYLNSCSTQVSRRELQPESADNFEKNRKLLRILRRSWRN